MVLPVVLLVELVLEHTNTSGAAIDIAITGTTGSYYGSTLVVGDC